MKLLNTFLLFNLLFYLNILNCAEKEPAHLKDYRERISKLYFENLEKQRLDIANLENEINRLEKSVTTSEKEEELKQKQLADLRLKLNNLPRGLVTYDD